jgi:thiazole/oxazole-forming peptide maturase SagC family component
MRSYILSYDVRAFCKNDKFYFRKGVWNTLDGIIDLTECENKEALSTVLIKLIKKEKIDIDNVNLKIKDRKILEDLIDSKFIVESNYDYSLEMLKNFSGQSCKVNNASIDFFLITDFKEIDDIFALNKDIYKYSFKKMDDFDLQKLKDINFFSKMNSIDYENNLSYYRDIIGNLPVVVILQNVDLSLLQNINKICFETPIFIGLIDGPFLMFLSIQPGITACWECFESRMKAFIKDHILYNEFMNIGFENNFLNLLNLNIVQLVHMAIQEVFTWSNFQMGKFMGRVVYIYLPTYEIHVHRIERISSCKNCGYISRKNAIDSNLSLDRLVLEYIREIKK